MGDSSWVATSTTAPPPRGTFDSVPAALRVSQTELLVATRRVMTPRFFASVRGAGGFGSTGVAR